MEQVRRYFKKAIEYVSKPEMRVLPGQLAFFIVVSLNPLLALVGTIAGYFSVSTDKVMNILETVIPFELTDDIFISLLYRKNSNRRILLLLLLTRNTAKSCNHHRNN